MVPGMGFAYALSFKLQLITSHYSLSRHRMYKLLLVVRVRCDDLGEDAIDRCPRFAAVVRMS